MNGMSKPEMELRINELEIRLEESEQLIDAIKAGEVDAFAINKNNESEIYTLQSGDYAYRVLIENFGEGAVNVTEDGLIVYTNTHFCNLIKVPYQKVIGAHFTDFIHSDSKELYQNLFQNSLSAHSTGEINLNAIDNLIPVSLSLTSLQPKLETVGIIITDYTEKKKIENVILDYQKNLELNNDQLKHSNAELASFVYVASHDLQEPLRKIQMFASRIFDDELESLSKTGILYFNKMQSEANRMQNLIHDLLAYARTGKPELKYESTNLKKILEEVMVELNEDLIASEAVVDIRELSYADIVQFQFKQLLHNLISNSIKFAKLNNPPYITIKSHIVQGNQIKKVNLPKKQKYCHLHIADKGIGFEQEHGEKIFEVFQRLHPQSQYQGSGVGLAIVKKIVDNHDGAISVTSSPTNGASFDIFIPMRPVAI